MWCHILGFGVLFYLVIGFVFSGFMILWAPENYKHKMKDPKIIEVLTLLWPVILISFIFWKFKKH